MNFNFLKFLEKKSDRPESLVVNNPMNRGYDQDAFYERVAEKVSKDRQKYREKAVIFAVEKGYKHTDNIKEIKMNTQFYEVNTNNGVVSERKQINEEKDRNILIESTAPYFIITDKDIDPYALQSEDQEHLKTKRGGKRIKGTRKSKRKKHNYMRKTKNKSKKHHV